MARQEAGARGQESVIGVREEEKHRIRRLTETPNVQRRSRDKDGLNIEHSTLNIELRSDEEEAPSALSGERSQGTGERR